jgi:hypothetical protein
MEEGIAAEQGYRTRKRCDQKSGKVSRRLPCRPKWIGEVRGSGVGERGSERNESVE